MKHFKTVKRKACPASSLFIFLEAASGPRSSRRPRPCKRPPRRVRPTTTQPRPVGRRWHKNSIKNTSRGEGRNWEEEGGGGRRAGGRPIAESHYIPPTMAMAEFPRPALSLSLALSGRPASATARFYAPLYLAFQGKLLQCLPKKDNLYYLPSSQDIVGAM